LEAFKLNSEADDFDRSEKIGHIEMEDGFQLHTVSWFPSGMKVLILLVHGLGEHVMRYRHWASYFYSNKIGILGFDMRGHGHNTGTKGNFNYNLGINDINVLLRFLQEQYPFIPKLIYGNSMGGNFVLRYAIEYKPLITGLIVTSPWIKLTNAPSEAIVSVVSFLLHSLCNSNTMSDFD